jgi:polysaccharide biosynthesis/export protein
VVRGDAADHLIVRPEKGEEKKYPIRELAIGDLSKDPYVQPGDKIYAPAAEIFYIYGKVNAPGVYTISSDMTVRQAIARAGGLAESGSDKKIDTTREGKKVKVALSDKVQPGDVIVIGERLF